jgi:prepilin-type N-terminal cleavage/methylation domain-containing protein
MLKKSHGFSLAELMMVVAIIAIMALITAPNLVTGLPSYRIKAAVRDCTSQLRNARHLAIKDKRNVTVTFDANSHMFEVDGRRFPVSGSFTKEYGSGVGFGEGSAANAIGGGSIPSDGVDFNGNEFSFTARGLAEFGAGAANGAVYFTNNRGDSYAVAVSAAGAVALLRWRDNEWKR